MKGRNLNNSKADLKRDTQSSNGNHYNRSVLKKLHGNKLYLTKSLP
jgi:hypothetical protein